MKWNTLELLKHKITHATIFFSPCLQTLVTCEIIALNNHFLDFIY